jgi:hypothetical protein
MLLVSMLAISIAIGEQFDLPDEHEQLTKKLAQSKKDLMDRCVPKA